MIERWENLAQVKACMLIAERLGHSWACEWPGFRVGVKAMYKIGLEEAREAFRRWESSPDCAPGIAGIGPWAHHRSMTGSIVVEASGHGAIVEIHRPKPGRAEWSKEGVAVLRYYMDGRNPGRDRLEFPRAPVPWYGRHVGQLELAVGADRLARFMPEIIQEARRRLGAWEVAREFGRTAEAGPLRAWTVGDRTGLVLPADPAWGVEEVEALIRGGIDLREFEDELAERLALQMTRDEAGELRPLNVHRHLEAARDAVQAALEAVDYADDLPGVRGEYEEVGQ